MRDAYLAQSGGNNFYELTHVRAREEAAGNAGKQFFTGDVLFNGALMFLGPITGGIGKWMQARTEAKVMKLWSKVGVEAYEVYNTPKLWDETTIRNFVQRTIQQIKEGKRKGNIAEVEIAQHELLKIRAADSAAYELTARSFKGAFQDLEMRSTSFKDTEIRAAYIARLEKIKTQASAKNLSAFQKMKLRHQAESAERAYDDLRLFAESYAQMFSAGPFARLYNRGLIRANIQMELEFRAKVAEDNARIWGQDPKAAADEARAQFKMEVDGKIHDGELSPEEAKKFADRLIDQDLMTSQLALSRSLERRGQSIYDFWESGAAPRMQTADHSFVWYFRSEPRHQSAAFDVRKNYYAILDVPPQAATSAIEASFNRLAELHKSGKARDGIQIATPDELWEAFHVLMDPSRRAAFDVFLISRGEWITAAQSKSAAGKAAQDVKHWGGTNARLPSETFYPTSGLTPEQIAARDAFVQRYTSVDLRIDYYADLGVSATASKGDMIAALDNLRYSAGVSLPGESGKIRFEAAARAFQLLADPVFRSYYDIFRVQRAGGGKP